MHTFGAKFWIANRIQFLPKKNSARITNIWYSKFTFLCQKILNHFRKKYVKIIKLGEHLVQVNLFQKLATSAEYVVYQNCSELLKVRIFREYLLYHVTCSKNEHKKISTKMDNSAFISWRSHNISETLKLYDL